MEKERQASSTGKESTPKEVLMNLLVKLHECEKGFYEQMEIIGKQNPDEQDTEKEGKFYGGISDCMATVGYFIGEYVIRETCEQSFGQNPNVIIFETSEQSESGDEN
ncbi:hypothetical protein EZS27_001551 [termite gut metagenome]|uniref:Uncharacterized protein n=1 Tax=termite gut metagenome TaxID=433724 RepID=A0A5J4T127_9ZZZZ